MFQTEIGNEDLTDMKCEYLYYTLSQWSQTFEYAHYNEANQETSLIF